ncbi:hypothetical protein Rsub_00367 [Raphidocelis subcapitata]|uniref:Cilia- and flagella-associated protein 69 ARM repeats domain-containing protein n=1 Tax=Raphidocelis subcapitata TaxID=307507 RepID=A0A2V0NK54_9CHLO|nr:hypothetical protein Rsub_00367 [Raphidocelis subcapitata]|eukprot:GBF87656.1 hypothetical protein Rsub_00367 [Raphidocelis subcapitata]
MVQQIEAAAPLSDEEKPERVAKSACRGRGASDAAPPVAPAAAAASAPAAAALDHALALLLDPKARGLHARHAAAVERVVRRAAAEGGLAIGELPRTALLLELTLRVVAEQGSDCGGAGAAVFIAPLCDVLQLLGQPLVRRALSDEARLPGALAAGLSALSSALAEGMPQQVQGAAAAALEAIASAYYCRPSALQLAAAAAPAVDQQERRRASGAHSSSLLLPLLPPPPPDADAADAAAWRAYHLNQSLIHGSGAAVAAADTLMAALRDAAADAAAEAPLLQALLACSLWPDTCAQLAQHGALRLAAALLRRHGCEPPALTEHGSLQTVIELLWNVVERAPAAGLEAALGAAECAASPAGSDASPEAFVSTVGAQLLATLGAACGRLLRCTHSRATRELRNDALVALQHLCAFRDCAAAAPSDDGRGGDAALSVLLSAAAAGGSAAPALEQHGARACSPQALPPRDELDIEMQLVAWGALSDAAEAHPDCLAAVVADGRLIPLLMAHAQPSKSSSSSNSSSSGGDGGGGGMRDPAACLVPEHRTALRRAAWSALLRIAPLATPQFLEACDGGGGLIAMLATGGAGDDESIEVAEAAARLVQHLCRGSGSGAEAAAALARRGAVGALLQLLRLQAPSAEGEERVRCAALLALAALCVAGGAECRKLLRSGRGVGALVAELERLHAADSTLPSAHLLAALGAVWRCILPDARARAEFLARDGVDALALLLERCNKHVRPLLLSVLSDLLADARAAPFFLEWRSPRDPALGLPHLLLAAWREADAACAASNADGLLARTTRPFAGACSSGGCDPGSSTARVGGRAAASLPASLAATLAGAVDAALGTSPSPAGSAGRQPNQGPAAAPAYGYLCPERRQLLERIAAAAADAGAVMDKVYACLSQAGFEAVEPLLPAPERAALAVVRRYASLREGEVWAEVRGALEAEGVAPTDEDAARIQSGLRSAEALAEAVRDEQAALLAAHARAGAEAEAARYAARLRQARAEAEARRYQKDESKLTMRERLAAKARREAMLARSVVGAAAGGGGAGSLQAAVPAG